MYELFKRKNDLNILVISDLHLCNKLDRLDLLYKAYEYAQSNKIRYVVNLGDVIDSIMPHNKSDLKITDIDSQIKYVIDNYPRINNIKTLMLYGNHDYYSKYMNGIDVADTISHERRDLFNLGYGESYINILDNYIKLKHEISFLKEYKKNIDTFVTFLGHYHSFKIKMGDDSLNIYAPSLSNLNPSSGINIPSMLDVNFTFNNDILSKVDINCIDMDKKNMISSSFEVGMNINKKRYLKIKEQFHHKK